MTIEETTFHAGWNPDGDGNDTPGFRTLHNVDVLYIGRGQARTRYPATPYADFHQESIPAPAGMFLWKWLLWDSGVVAPQTNSLLIFRTVTAPFPATPLLQQWSIYTNAPSLSDTGDPNTWTLIEDRKVAPVCNLEAVGGTVRIAFGNVDYGSDTNDYRIFTDLCANGNRLYCTADRTISRATVDVSRDLGEGGKIFKGWLYDWGKLYHPWDSARRATNMVITSNHVLSGTGLLDFAEYVVLFVPVCDDEAVQYGVPIGWTYPQIAQQYSLEWTILVAGGYAWSPRITGLAMYVIRRNHQSGDWTDYARIKTIPVNSLAAPTSTITVTLTQTEIVAVPESSWAADTSAREIPGTAWASVALNPLTGEVPTTAAGHDAMEDAISVKPAGFAFQKETMFAWGCGDKGQMQLRLSCLDDDRGQYDVFPKNDVSWNAGMVQKINHVATWESRLVVITDTNMTFLEPADPLRARDSYMVAEESKGVGLPMEYLRTFAVAKGGCFWANRYGVWLFAGGRAINIAEDRWLDVWNNLTETQRQSAVGAYNSDRQEYWLAIGDTVYIWADASLETKFWRTYSYDDWTAHGYVVDRKGRFVAFGMLDNTTRVLLVNDPEGTYDYNDETGGTVNCIVESRDRGPRANDMILGPMTVTQESDSSQMFHVELYGDRGLTPWFQFVFLGSERKPMTIQELRCAELRWLISWTYTGGTRPELKGVLIDTRDEMRRSG